MGVPSKPGGIGRLGARLRSPSGRSSQSVERPNVPKTRRQRRSEATQLALKAPRRHLIDRADQRDIVARSVATFSDCPALDVYTTCPDLDNYLTWRAAAEQGLATDDGTTHMRRVREVSRWSDELGCRGILVYTDNSKPEPWTVAQAIILATTQLAPLIALNPVYLHPVTAAKKIATFSYYYGRGVDLNFVAGGFRVDLAALGDTATHGDRYDRVAEYAEILLALLRDGGPVTMRGRYFVVSNLTLRPPFDQRLMPRVLMSGSSEDGWRCAERVGARPVQHPKPLHEDHASGLLHGPNASSGSTVRGMRVGIIARATQHEAWREATRRFPLDPQGRAMREVWTAISDSSWVHQLASASATRAGQDAYWIEPLKHYKTFCPYLVGSYETVGVYLARYLAAGVRTIILDEPLVKADLIHAAEAFAVATRAWPLVDGA